MFKDFIKRNFYTLSFIFIFFISILLRVLPLFHQEIWLDERYSLYFAQSFSWKELLFAFKYDIHPGFYYLVIKLFLNLTRSLIFLRILTSLLPQLLGVGIILFLVKKISRNDNKALLVSAFILGLNPLLILSSWQLRSYNFVIFFVSIVLLSINWFLKKKSLSRLFIVFLSCLIANLSFYGVFVYTFSSLLYCVFKYNINKKLKIGIFVLGSIIFLIQFFIMSGFQIKQQFEQANWLPAPAFDNIPSVFLTVVGFKNNYFTPGISSVLELTLFYFICLYFFLKLIIGCKKCIKEKENCEWYLLVAMPILMFLVFTFLFPFLSNRYFLHDFIPKISFLIPRIFIPTIIFFSYYFSIWIDKIKFNRNIFLIFLLFGIVWIHNSLFVTFDTVFSETKLNNEISNILYQSNDENIIIYPSWYWMYGLDVNTKVNEIKKEILLSENFIYEKNIILNFPKKVFIYDPKTGSAGMIRDRKMFLEYINSIGCISGELDRYETNEVYYCE